MRALAEFIMKGRLQAVAVAGLGVGTLMFAWVGVAAAALVMLRKGLSEGAYVVFWAYTSANCLPQLSARVSLLCCLTQTAISNQTT